MYSLREGSDVIPSLTPGIESIESIVITLFAVYLFHYASIYLVLAVIRIVYVTSIIPIVFKIT